jgi:hypothetical protein
LSSLHLACRETRYLDGAVRLLLRLIKVKWELKDGYDDPVSHVSRERVQQVAIE